MPYEAPDPDGLREEWQELAELLCDQFVALGHRRPAVARVVGDGEVILLVVSWPGQTNDTVLRQAAPALAELVTLEIGREVDDLGAAITDDGCRAMVSFLLGKPIVATSERFEAVQAWCTQVQRNAREQQSRYRERHRELVRLRAEMIGLRAELRARRSTLHRAEDDRLIRR